jgi:PAS domain S-box-containing protein
LESAVTATPAALPDLRRGHQSTQALVFARMAALLAIAIGLTVLLGWHLNSPQLKQVLAEAVSMKANAALGFVVGGVALILFSYRPTRALGRLLGLLILIGAGLTLSQDILLVDLRFDESLFVEPPGTPYTFSPGRMSPPSAIAFVLLGLAFLTSARQHVFWLAFSQLVLAVILIQSVMVLIGYGYGVTQLYYPFPFTAMAVHCAAAHALLAAGLLATCPDRGLALAMTDESAGGQMFRRLLPGIILIPILLGWLRNQGEIAGLYDSVTGTALFSVSTIVLIIVFSWMIAAALRRMDEDRLEALSDLHGQREWLTTTLASIADAVIATDASGAIQLMNPVAENLTGWTAAEANGRPIWDVFRIVDEDVRESQEDPALKALREKRVVENASHIMITRDEAERPIECNSAPIMANDGTVAGAVLVFRDVTLRRRAEEQQNMVVGELNHRVRNVLMIVHSLVQASAQHASGKTAEEMAQVLANRLQSLSRAHELLLETHWKGASLKGIIERELEPFQREKAKSIVIKGTDVLLPPQCTSVVAMAVHELTTNAAKYGALSQPDGRLSVDWRVRRSTLHLHWVESKTEVGEAKGRGFGMRLIERGIQQNLGGKTEVAFLDDGLKATIEIPLEQAVEETSKPAKAANDA